MKKIAQIIRKKPTKAINKTAPEKEETEGREERRD